jgi:hypothetical protein
MHLSSGRRDVGRVIVLLVRRSATREVPRPNNRLNSRVVKELPLDSLGRPRSSPAPSRGSWGEKGPRASCILEGDRRLTSPYASARFSRRGGALPTSIGFAKLPLPKEELVVRVLGVDPDFDWVRQTPSTPSGLPPLWSRREIAPGRSATRAPGRSALRRVSGMSTRTRPPPSGSRRPPACSAASGGTPARRAAGRSGRGSTATPRGPTPRPHDARASDAVPRPAPGGRTPRARRSPGIPARPSSAPRFDVARDNERRRGPPHPRRPEQPTPKIARRAQADQLEPEVRLRDRQPTQRVQRRRFVRLESLARHDRQMVDSPVVVLVGGQEVGVVVRPLDLPAAVLAGERLRTHLRVGPRGRLAGQSQSPPDDGAGMGGQSFAPSRRWEAINPSPPYLPAPKANGPRRLMARPSALTQRICT